MKVLSNFGYALEGIKYCYKHELNFRIHLTMMVIVLFLGAYLSINKTEWIAVISCCTLVMLTEMINTAIENICDHLTVDFHPIIKIIKDVSAGAVLLSAVGSFIIGSIIFLPKIFN